MKAYIFHFRFMRSERKIQNSYEDVEQLWRRENGNRESFTSDISERKNRAADKIDVMK